MKQIFEPVFFEGTMLQWDYLIRTEHDFKGYYHWHQCCEIIFVHEGKGSVVVDRQAYDIRRGMFFFFQPFQLHHIYAEVSPDCPYVRSIFYVDPLWIEDQLRPFPKRRMLFKALWQGLNQTHAYDLFENAAITEWIYASYDSARNNGRGTDAEEITLLILQILQSLEGAYPRQQDPTAMAGRTLRYSEIVMQWIEEHYQEEVSLDRLAEETHLSKYYVSRVFRQETGSSITDYLTARRMKQACKLLVTTDLPVEQIGIRCGIPNVSYFVQMFKRVVGTTPLKYRNSVDREGKLS